MSPKKITVYDFINKVRLCTPIDNALLKAAKESPATTWNNSNLKSIVQMWDEGWYDESPIDVIPQIKTILKIQ